MQQMIVLNLNKSIYIRATECSMLYVVLIQCDTSLLNDMEIALQFVARSVTGWAHINRDVPDFYAPEDKAKVIDMVPFGEW